MSVFQKGKERLRISNRETQSLRILRNLKVAATVNVEQVFRPAE